MKKTLIAVAALSAMAASAMAANVTLSGTVDLGFNYTHKDASGVKTNTFTMNDGQNSASKFMLKGSEDLGNNVEVGFQLENQFTADDGLLKESNSLFRRESRLYVKTDFGTLHFGRFGGLDAGTGSLSIFGGSDTSAFGTGWGDSIGKGGNVLKLSDRYNNSVAYVSPKFAGFSLYLDHSFKTGTTGTEGKPSAQQYNAAGLKYANGAFNAAFVFSQQNYATTSSTEADNGQFYSLGAGYNFGVCKLMAQAQYFDQGETLTDGEKGWGATLAVTAPVSGGTLYASLGYKDSKDSAKTKVYDYKAWNLGVGYKYPFSKRTSVYVAAGYTDQKKDPVASDVASTKTKTTEVITGIVHTF